MQELLDSSSIGITAFMARIGVDPLVYSGDGFIIILFSANGTEAFFSYDGRRVSNHGSVSAKKDGDIAH